MPNTTPPPDLPSRVRGCLLAGAVGDALGAPVEFASLAAIRARYGPDGVTDLDRAYEVPGAVTDDTQMTLFTAEGLLRAAPGDEVASVHRAYLRWLMTQRERSFHPAFGDAKSGWLIEDGRLHHRRAPGMTCLAGLQSERMGTMTHRLNDSKGCGGVMRAAPVGLLAKSKDEAFRLGCETAAITHGHPSGYLASGALAVMVWTIVHDGADLGAACDAAEQALEASGDAAGECLDALRAARALAAEGNPSAEKLESLGEAWVAEEALGMSVYAALAAGGDLRRGLLLAVNHSGDADSTGAIAGNLLGAWLGEGAIPASWRTGVEMADLIARFADDVVGAIQGQPIDAARYPTP